jgi:Xaa-Pro aminopeptidase
MGNSFEIDNNTVKKNIAALQKFMVEHDLDAFVVTSFDPYLNEYVPMENCHRFFVTKFTGSTAEVLVPKTGRAKLYVDGRYHEQADLEVDATAVEVVKPKKLTIQKAMFEDVTKLGCKRVGVEADRIPLGYVEKIEALSEVVGFFGQELNQIMDFPAAPALPEVQLIAKEHRGPDTTEKLARVIADKTEGYFVTAIDSLAWITNCRGYHLPNLSSFLGRGFVTHDKVYVFVEPDVPVSEAAAKEAGVEFVSISIKDLPGKLKELQSGYSLSKLYYDPGMLNLSDYNMLLEVFGERALEAKAGGLVSFHAIKDEAEVAEMNRGFAAADKAIYNTIKWVKEQIAAGKDVSELDLYHETTKKYQDQGAKEQSFNTIAGVGPNGSIIHYGDPKADVKITKDDMILLDSGGYFAGGFATDTTRTFMASDAKPNKDYIKMYTLVLKGLLQAQNAIFPEGVSGAVLDGLARAPLFRTGQNYNHGTGHGVGIHVHEGGARISPVGHVPMKEGQAVSIEPGLYIPGFAGVRLENIALVEKHPEFEGFLRFKSFVYIGFEPSLIDMDMLDNNEKQWLEDYEAECTKRGTSFR